MSVTVRFRLPLANTRVGDERTVSASQARLLTRSGAAEIVESPERATEPAPATAEPEAEPTPQEIREWAAAYGLTVSDRGKIPAHIRQAYADNH